MLGIASEVLQLTGQAKFGWAGFDAAWYLRRYPDVTLIASPDDPEAVLRFYLVTGQQSGHSPNMYFDEAWYLRQYPTAAQAVRDGKFASGFDEYCGIGYGGRSPHWLYDDYIYRMSGEELTAAGAQAEGYANRYDHYLRHGSHHERRAHLFFDPAFYRAQLDAAEATNADQAGAFHHFLHRIASGAPTPRTSVYFDPAWYARSYPNAATEIGTSCLCALHHYLTNTNPTAFDPIPEFSETSYLDRHPDVAATVATGGLRNGYQHFLTNGVFELRAPNDTIDLRRYVSTHQWVATDLQSGRARDAFAHLLSIGRAAGLSPAPIAEDGGRERQAKGLFRNRAENLVPLVARHPLGFAVTSTPDLSVTMVLQDNFALTIQTLASLRRAFPGSIELILIDSGSSDETRFISRYVRGAQVLRFDDDVGFIPGCNAAITCATASATLLLGNDVELGLNAPGLALNRLNSDPRIGAVGGKIIRTHGVLQEAGSIIWRDGVTLGYMRDASPLTPEANFVRDVDFCSSTFLLLRTDVLKQLEGFRDDSAPPYHEDADLCIRVAQAGYRVVYDPSVVIYHHEYGSPAAVRAAEQRSDQSRKAFVRQNLNYLRFRYIADQRATVFARSTSKARRILFIEEQIPLRSLGSGFGRSNDLLRTMAKLGFHVTIFSIFAHRFDVAALYADIPDTIEVLYDKTLDNLPEFLDSRDEYFDTIWVARTHNLDRVRQMLERYALGKGNPPRVVLDTEAIASVRDQTRATLTSQAYDRKAALAAEFHGASCCQNIVAVTEAEADLIRSIGYADVSVIGFTRELSLGARDFDARQGLLFIGAIHEMDSPNYDSLCWFTDTVLPLVEQQLGYETQLTVAGYTAPHVTLERFENHPRIRLSGQVAETETLYNAHRVFIAPTRFAAGAPYKLYEAASHGVPIAATELLRGQLGWQHGLEILSADISDPAKFADNIVALYRDRELWHRLRDNAADRLRRENSPEHYVNALSRILL
jgi:GT2 family glycosyltransferase/glycosyltransferase involved in cell wall biosynthesis